MANEFGYHNPHRNPEDDDLFTASYYFAKAKYEWDRAGWANPGVFALRRCGFACARAHAVTVAPALFSPHCAQEFQLSASVWGLRG